MKTTQPTYLSIEKKKILMWPTELYTSSIWSAICFRICLCILKRLSTSWKKIKVNQPTKHSSWFTQCIFFLFSISKVCHWICLVFSEDEITYSRIACVLRLISPRFRSCRSGFSSATYLRWAPDAASTGTFGEVWMLLSALFVFPVKEGSQRLKTEMGCFMTENDCNLSHLLTGNIQLELHSFCIASAPTSMLLVRCLNNAYCHKMKHTRPIVSPKFQVWHSLCRSQRAHI